MALTRGAQAPSGSTPCSAAASSACAHLLHLNPDRLDRNGHFFLSFAPLEVGDQSAWVLLDDMRFS
jgi:hypothetical protein